MNKSAAKEPSMDEILSSIRQIIADDDAGVAPSAATTPAEDEPLSFDIPDQFDVPEMMPATEEEPDALELSAEQIVTDDSVADDDPVEGFDFPDLSAAADEETFDQDGDDFTVPELVVPDDISFDGPAPSQMREEPAVSETAPMPDKDLSSDMAKRLLEPTTDAAVKSAFAKLGNVALGTHDMTIENMIREMLRPMLKEWLDENLPSVVENIVEKEIERLSRGG
ncbi:PopZ family protein [Mariluticola halotolerans]|uniref:PopZ family protein n=1 Tax=Mariluticola halotolerans TaxID=2909283 RepID=UPI0026E1F53B|nr:DUF2497 domain-containing protein [Mariluticola halotolerans]UJQ95078.1 DUF2497 domain-containing protein [Mariluticola halotolerans]